MKRRELLWLSGCLLWLTVLVQTTESEKRGNADKHHTCSSDDATVCPSPESHLRVPQDCHIVMAPSDLSGWGLFALKDFNRANIPILGGDAVIAVSDPLHIQGMSLLVRDYLWDSQETGQFYEGQTVLSVLPGVGMLANGHATRYNLLLEREPSMGDAGITRTSPAAGSFSLHYNQSFYLQHAIKEGTELLVTYGEPWFQERNIALDSPPPKTHEWLLQHGYCVDNLQSGISNNKARGAFATRPLVKDAIVAPVPVLPLLRTSLNQVRQRVSGQHVSSKQLLLNYCLGHSKSSLLLYPYSPFVNLINLSNQSANVKLEWASQQDLLLQKPLDDILAMPGLLLELVALRDIQAGEEILLDYGQEWQQAWEQHVNNNKWKPYDNAKDYVPSYNYTLHVLKTQAELQRDPYPDNLFTSCFYRYHSNKQVQEEEVTVDQWKLEETTMELRNLRPCHVLERDDSDHYYTVQIGNRFDHTKRISHRAHIVTHVPRHAIRFSDKLYTTDPHLEGAFRHEISLSIYPPQWLDLA